MNRIAMLAVAIVVAGCAAAAAPPAEPGRTFTGEVWTWDQQESVVTLRQAGQSVRVKVSPDQLRGLRLHQTVTLRGELAPPAALPVFTVPAVPMRAVPRGAPDVAEMTGAVTAVDPSGRVAITSGDHALHLWAAAGAQQRFKVGAQAQATMTVQPMTLVPAGDARPADPPAPETGTPGDHAVVTGRVIGVNPGGTLVVESPAGPVQVWVPNPGRYAVGDTVQVRTTVLMTP